MLKFSSATDVQNMAVDKIPYVLLFTLPKTILAHELRNFHSRKERIQGPSARSPQGDGQISQALFLATNVCLQNFKDSKFMDFEVHITTEVCIYLNAAYCN